MTDDNEYISSIDCKNLAPEWSRAATELKGKVKLGVVDATVHTQISQQYGIQGFPTIKFFPAGKKNGQAEDYNGGRTASVCHHHHRFSFYLITKISFNFFLSIGYCCLGYG